MLISAILTTPVPTAVPCVDNTGYDDDAYEEEDETVSARGFLTEKTMFYILTVIGESGLIFGRKLLHGEYSRVFNK